MEKQEYILPVTYVKCTFCTAKNHCTACGGELTGDLRAKTGAEDAVVDLLAHTVRIRTGLTQTDIEDLLEGMGLMAD